jgi:transposase
MHGTAFLARIEHVLVPDLREGDIVVMDNLASHKVAGAREMSEAVGNRLIYQSPYSPNFNPIEMAFSKLNAPLRKAAVTPRTIFGTPSHNPSKLSRRLNVRTTSSPQYMIDIELKILKY